MNALAYLKVFCCASFFGFFYQCANQSAPTGGPEDKDPPKANVTKPKDQATLVKTNEIVVEFDEYIQLDNPLQNVIINPPLDSVPNFRVAGKKLIVSWKGSLQVNTTYLFQFINAIKDNNQGNTLKEFVLAFTTGAAIDSAAIDGRIVEASTGKALKEARILLFPQGAEDFMKSAKPKYLVKSNEEGYFTFNNVSTGYYQIGAFKDLNLNGLWDLPEEYIAFYRNVVFVDSTRPTIQLYAFQELQMTPKFKEVSSLSGQFSYRFVINGVFDDLSIVSKEKEYAPFAIFQDSLAKDTVLIWLKDTLFEQHTFFLFHKESVNDSITLRNPSFVKQKKQQGSPQAQVVSKELTRFPDRAFILSIKAPISYIDTPKLQSWIREHQLSEVVLVDPFRISFRFKDDLKHPHVLPFADSTFFVFPKQVIYVDSVSLKTLSKEDLGTWEIRWMVTPPQNGVWVVELIDPKGAVLRTAKLNGSQERVRLRIYDLIPGTYKMRWFEDLNGNLMADPGDYISRRQPEIVYGHSHQFIIKPNWDLVTEIKIAPE